MKNKKVLFSTLMGAIIIAVVLEYGPIKEVVYGEGWPRILIGVVLFLVILVFSLQELQKSRRFHKEFAAYVSAYDLTPEKLGRLTSFHKYDFSYDGKVLRFENGTTENRAQLLADLRRQFGPIEKK
jgi:hypothetical protein